MPESLRNYLNGLSYSQAKELWNWIGSNSADYELMNVIESRFNVDPRQLTFPQNE